jgi:hypothetical protein
MRTDLVTALSREQDVISSVQIGRERVNIPGRFGGRRFHACCKKKSVRLAMLLENDARKKHDKNGALY